MGITTLGIDLAKSVFQLHGVDERGGIVLQKKLRRGAVLTFLSKIAPCLIGMEACATSHFWARQIAALGHDVRLKRPALNLRQGKGGALQNLSRHCQIKLI